MFPKCVVVFLDLDRSANGMEPSEHACVIVSYCIIVSLTCSSIEGRSTTYLRRLDESSRPLPKNLLRRRIDEMFAYFCVQARNLIMVIIDVVCVGCLACSRWSLGSARQSDSMMWSRLSVVIWMPHSICMC